MKSPTEIRAHVRNLRRALKEPCACAGTAHASRDAACLVGGMMTQAAIDALTWALEENEGYQELVDRFARTPRERR